MSDFTYEEVMGALRNADAAGATADASRLAEIAYSMKDQKVGAGDTPKGSYLAEAGRKGLASFPSTVYGAFKGAFTGEGQTGAQKYAKEAEQKIIGMLGGTGAQPEGIVEKILATGVESAADPMSYLLPGSKAIGMLGPIAKPVGRAAENFFAGAGAEAGGTAGEYAGRKIGDETGAMVGRVGGALIGGSTSSIVAGSLPRTAVMLSDAGIALAPKVRQLYRQLSSVAPNDQITREAGRHIENVFVAAAASDPNFAKVLEEAAVAQAATGVKLPLSSVLKDNAVINQYIAQLAAKDPTFREAYYSSFQAAKEALRSKAEKIFGKPSIADEVLTANVKDVDISGAVSRKKASIDRKMVQASRNLDTIDPADFGAKVIKVTDDAESAARASVAPLYTNAFDIAKQKGIVLPSESVGDIYQFVAGEKANDIFKTFPSIYGKIVSRFKPQTVEGANLVDASGRPIGSQTGEAFKGATVEDLDSLKREVNAQLRKTKTDSEIRLLTELKSKVNQHISTLDNDFVSAYRLADQTYLQKVGLPFNEETINMIGRAKFDENVVPLLTKNKSTLTQFVDATGENGKKLAEQAFISDLTNFAVKDGVLDPARVNAWLKNKNDALSMLPDVRERVIKASGNVKELMNQKAALGDKFVKAAEARILKLEGKNAQSIVNSIYGSADFTEKFMKQHGANPDNLKAIRSFMLDDLLSSGKPLELLGDRTKARAFNRVFGPTYADKVRQLSVIADRITHDPSAVSANLSSIPKSRIEELVGAPPEMIISRITNPVMSNFYAFTSLMSKFLNRRVNESVDKDMKRILLDPKEAALLFKAVQPRVDKMDMQKMANDVAEYSKKAGLNFADMLMQDVKSGAARSYKGMDEQTTQEQQQ